MNKANLIRQITDQLQQELDSLLHASDQAHQSATHSESRAENKYDTLGLEAAYLAHGLSLRAQQLQRAIAAFRLWTAPSFGPDDSIDLGALVWLQSEDGTEKRLLLAAQGGGLKAADEGRDNGDITVVTPTSPLGKALLGKQLDDEIMLDIRGTRSLYQVIGLA